MIATKDISVIIQGPIYADITDKTVANIRDMFPDSQIIVSTWAGSNYKNQNADIVVESDDPGGFPLYDNPKILNASNRQIVSTMAGLRQATRLYSLKIRTDMFFKNTNFLKYWDRYPVRSNEYKILKHRILLSTSFAPNPHREPKPFHPSDWFFFGLTEDLVTVFDSPLCPEPETARYFETHPRPIVKYDSWIPALTQYPAEQYIWVAFLRRFIDMKFQHCFDIENGNIEKSEQIFANNTVLLDAVKIGYDSYKHKNLHTDFEIVFMYTHHEWRRMYKRYCDKSFWVFPMDIEKIRRLYHALRNKRPYKYHLMSLFNIRFKNQLSYADAATPDTCQ